MAVILKVKSRVGSTGAPTTLKTGEIAYNHIDDIFYIGNGDDGGGVALTIQEIAGSGFAKLASPGFTGVPTAPTATLGTDTTQVATTSFVKAAVESGLTGLDFQPDVLDIQVDAILDPGTTPTNGDRYIITDSAALNANFGTITGVENGDIVEYDLVNFVVKYDVSVQGEGALVWDRNSNTWQRYDGTNWADFGGLAGITAGDGLTKSGDVINVATASATRIVINADSIDLATTAVTPGAYQGITIDSYGRVTAAADQGYLDGALGAVDNALMRADGTGGKTGQGSAITVADDGTMSGAIIEGGTY
jgi:hypothetical protein